jgi:hypothetical protein
MNRAVTFFAAVCLCVLSGNSALAQTNPAAQPLPFSLTAQTGSTLPAGVAVHRFGTTAAAIPTTRTTAPGNGDLPYPAQPTSGGWRDEGDNGLSLLASGSNAAGALIVALDTTGQTNIRVSWIARTILQQASRDNSIALQYRVGTTGNYTDVDPSVYTSAGKGRGRLAGLHRCGLTGGGGEPALCAGQVDLLGVGDRRGARATASPSTTSRSQRRAARPIRPSMSAHSLCPHSATSSSAPLPLRSPTPSPASI